MLSPEPQQGGPPGAIAVIATQGEVFSVGDITSRAGMSHGTFYNYFEDTGALIAAVAPEVLTSFAVQRAADEADELANRAVAGARSLSDSD